MVLPLQAVSLRFRRLAPWPFLWLGCRTAKIAATLDTLAEYGNKTLFQNGTKVLILPAGERNLLVNSKN